MNDTSDAMSDTSEQAEVSLPIHAAVVSKDAVAVRAFLEIDANAVNKRDQAGRSPLHLLASLDGNNQEILKLLLDAGVDINLVDNFGNTAFATALFWNNLKMATSLIVAGADVNDRDGVLGLSALHNATIKNNLTMMKNLLSLGADVNARDIGHETPLHKAASYDKNHSHFKAFETLLTNGADVNARDRLGQTVLHLLMKQRHRKAGIIRLLLKYGADVNVPDNDGQSPLSRAINDPAILKLLMSCGVNFDIRTPDGSTPLHHACRIAGNFEVVKSLLNYGVDIDAQDQDGRSPIMCAADQDIFVLLLNSGADVHVIDANGQCILSSNTLPDHLVREILMIIVAKLQVTSVPINPIIINSILHREGCDNFSQMCKNELERAKVSMIKDFQISHFDFLVMSKKELRACAGNPAFINNFAKSRCVEQFPIYGDKMHCNMFEAINEHNLFFKSQTLLYSCLPFLDINEITSIIECLTTEDLLIFSEDTPSRAS